MKEGAAVNAPRVAYYRGVRVLPCIDNLYLCQSVGIISINQSIYR
jgi:hypothetical protein